MNHFFRKKIEIQPYEYNKCFSRVAHDFFSTIAGQKVDLFAPDGAIKSTLWPASRKK